VSVRRLRAEVADVAILLRQMENSRRLARRTATPRPRPKRKTTANRKRHPLLPDLPFPADLPCRDRSHKLVAGDVRPAPSSLVSRRMIDKPHLPHPLSQSLLGDRCPQEVRDLIAIDPSEARARAYELSQAGGRSNFDEARAIHSDLGKQSRRIYRLIENEVRRKFGHKKIGDAWTSETILYHLVRSIFSGNVVKRHHRPEWLEGLELDIYIEDLGLAIEYQGVQHFEPVKHWGGAEALKLVQERDRRKARICRDRGVSLRYFTHHDGLSETIVRDRLSKSDSERT